MATFYLKYRPQTIDELDLTNVRNQLSKVLASKNPPHAFLFSGPRGLGKTSAARIVAKAINCSAKQNDSVEPCNKCENCLSITSGNNIDVIEIDGASNRGIDDVRALREAVNLAPMSLAKKIIVIDEVHMLTKEAFNALLKTLEEPPSHVVFILATTEPQKLPDTIISRSFHIQFQRANEEELKRSLKRVIKGEKLKISDTVLAEVIARSEGGFRDATKMLEQLAFQAKNITDDIFAMVFPQTDIGSFLEYLSQKDGKRALEWINKVNDSGANWEDLTRKILERLRSYMLGFFGIGTMQNNIFSKEEVINLINLFTQAGKEIKYSIIETIPFEILVANYCCEEIGIKEEILKSSQASHLTDQNDETPSKKRGEKNALTTLSNNHNDTIKKSTVKEVKIEKTSKEIKRVKFQHNIIDVREKWDEILRIIKPYNFSVEALLKSSELVSLENGELTIKVFYEFHKGRLETDKCLSIVEKGFEKAFRNCPKIKYVLGERKEREIKIKKDDEKLVQTAEEIFG